MKKKIIKIILMLSTIAMTFPMSVNAASYRYYISSSSQSTTYIDMTYETTSEDVRCASSIYRHLESERNDGGSFTVTYNTSTSKSNSSNCSVSGGVSFAQVASASASVGISYSTTCSNSSSLSITKPDSVAAGYYYIGMHFPQFKCTYKKYIANSSGTKQQGTTTKVSDMQKKIGSYVQLDYSKNYPVFTC